MLDFDPEVFYASLKTLDTHRTETIVTANGNGTNATGNETNATGNETHATGNETATNAVATSVDSTYKDQKDTKPAFTGLTNTMTTWNTMLKLNFKFEDLFGPTGTSVFAVSFFEKFRPRLNVNAGPNMTCYLSIMPLCDLNGVAKTTVNLCVVVAIQRHEDDPVWKETELVFRVEIVDICTTTTKTIEQIKLNYDASFIKIND